MSITQQAIATRLGVSQTLVGKALKGNPRVAAATRERIAAVAAEMGYSSVTNSGARQMAARRYGNMARTGTIAVLFTPDFVGQKIHTLPYFMELFAAIETECQRLELDAMMMPLRETGLQGILREGLVDGAILLNSHGIAHLLRQLNIPLVLLNCQGPGHNSVYAEGYEGVRGLLEHLGQLGHRKIAFLSHTTDFSLSAQRYEGYRDGLLALGEIPRDALEEKCLYEPNLAAVEAALKRLWEREPGLTAVVCYNDFIAMQVITVLQSWGLDVPGQVSVTGFDDISVQSNFTIAITSVYYDRAAMARRSLSLLTDYSRDLYSNSNGATSGEAMKGSVVIRSSTGPVKLPERRSSGCLAGQNQKEN